MLGMMDKDKALTLILGDTAKPANVTEEKGEGYKLAAQEVMSALEAKDVNRFSSALKSFVYFCSHGEEAEED